MRARSDASRVLHTHAVWIWPLVLLIASLFVSAAAWVWTQRNVETHAQALFAAEVDKTVEHIQHGLQARAQLLRAFQGLVTTHPNPDAQLYAEFFQRVVPADQLPQIASIVYAQLVQAICLNMSAPCDEIRTRTTAYTQPVPAMLMRQ